LFGGRLEPRIQLIDVARSRIRSFAKESIADIANKKGPSSCTHHIHHDVNDFPGAG
jgi:hypothetical protein